MNPLLRASGGFILALLFCLFDHALWKRYSEADRPRSRTFARLLIIVDGPALISFCILVLFLLFTGPSDWGEEFVAGASAYNLLAINSIFVFMYGLEAYANADVKSSASEMPAQPERPSGVGSGD